MYKIRIWENEEYREMGESFIFDYFETVDEAIRAAKKIYDSHVYSAVEVEDEAGRSLYHISDQADCESARLS